jgi:hypothetical protein
MKYVGIPTIGNIFKSVLFNCYTFCWLVLLMLKDVILSVIMLSAVKLGVLR